MNSPVSNSFRSFSVCLWRSAGGWRTGFTGRCAGTKRLSSIASTLTGLKNRCRRKCVESFPVPEPDLIQLFAQPLNRLGIRYLVSGSVAAMLYGEPRVTHDIDFVVFLRATDIPLLSAAYPGPQFYVPPHEAIAGEATRERCSFNVIHAESGLKADFYLAGRDE